MQPARTLDQVLSELGTIYDPQVNLLRQQQSSIPGQIQEEERGLQAKQTQAFDDILGGARRRGLGFSGVPIQEQSKYTATEFLPAIARLRQSGREQATSLEQAILGINERKHSAATETQRYEQARYDDYLAKERAYAEARRQSAANTISPSLGGGKVGGAQTAASASIQQRADKGFNFTDANGRAISAAQYAQMKGVPFRQLLQQMANSGDAGAKQALGYVGDDFGYNAAKVAGNQNIASVLNSLLWGVNGVKAPAPARPNPVSSFLNTSVSLPSIRNAFGAWR